MTPVLLASAADNYTGLVISVMLLGFLVLVLVFPEKF
ncbi:MAG: K(+)-transporting ATPase subunit F [Acidimicrobiales bacterium]